MAKFKYTLNIIKRQPDPIGLRRFPDIVKKVQDWYTQDIADNVRLTGYVDRGTSVILLFQLIVEQGITVYDIAIEVNNTAVVLGKPLMEVEVYGVFSNMLSFKYMYTYLFARHRMIIPELEVKCNPLALSKPPTMTNKMKLLGIDKSLYAVSQWLSDTYGDITLSNLLRKPEVRKNKVNIKQLQHLIAHQDEITEIRKADKKKSHHKFEQNYNADNIVSEHNGSIQKKKYKSTISDRKSRRVIDDIRKNALTASGKKELKEKSAKVKVARNDSHHRITKKAKVKGKLRKKPKR